MTRAWTIATAFTFAVGLHACGGSGGGLKVDGGDSGVPGTGGSGGRGGTGGVAPGTGGTGGATGGTGGAVGGSGGRGGTGGATGGTGGATGGTGGRGGTGGATGGTGGATGGTGGRGGTGGATGGTGGRDAGLDFDALATAPACPADPQGKACMSPPMGIPATCQLPGDGGLLNRCICLMSMWQCAGQGGTGGTGGAGGGTDGGFPPIGMCPDNANGMTCTMANALCMGGMGGCICRAAMAGGPLTWTCLGGS